jgi:hypothetical protein
MSDLGSPATIEDALSGSEKDKFDVEPAFLNADLDIMMYVEWPKGNVSLRF